MLQTCFKGTSKAILDLKQNLEGTLASFGCRPSSAPSGYITVLFAILCNCLWLAQAADDTCGPSVESAERDQAQLAEAAVQENDKKKKPKKSRYELERYASKIVKMGDDGKEEFFQHLGRRMREAGMPPGSITADFSSSKPSSCELLVL